MSWNYTTAQRVATFAKIPVAEIQSDWSDWTEDLIDDFVGTTYTGTVSNLNEMHDGDGSPMLFVNNGPIVSVSALSISGGDFVSSDYKVFETYVELIGVRYTEQNTSLYHSAVFPVGVGNVLISYVGYTATVPPRVQLAATQMIATIALVNQREGADNSLKYSKVTQTQGDTVTTTAQIGLQSALINIMDKYLPPKVRIL
jgi:hypothetical protein